MELLAFEKKVQSYWTPERQDKFLAGRNFILTPWQGGPLLRSLGLLNKDASMSADASRKFIQINHILQLLKPGLKSLASQFKLIRIVDAGCGNAYLSFLIAWYLRDILKHPAEILAVDHNATMIERSVARAKELNYDSMLRFAISGLENFAWPEQHQKAFPADEPATRPNAFLALHACDTATDYALAEALRLKADLIAVAPCCQAELARFWQGLGEKPALALAPVIQSAHFRRVVAADMTDVLRTLLIRSRGYAVTATEFVASEHTPKNRLLLAERRGRYLDSAYQEFTQLKASLGNPLLCLEQALEANLPYAELHGTTPPVPCQRT